MTYCPDLFLCFKSGRSANNPYLIKIYMNCNIVILFQEILVGATLAGFYPNSSSGHRGARPAQKYFVCT